MRILHTSDWHLGKTLHGKKRHEEHRLFLDWLLRTIEEEGVDALLVSGDIFDSTTPGATAQTLYYNFLCGVAASSCGHVVIIAGNHDSPSLLNAPRDLLRTMSIHVVGSLPEDSKDEIVLLEDRQGIPKLLVCAVPFLRDRDIRKAQAGESPEQKDANLMRGILDHYALVMSLADQTRQALGLPALPIAAMGHLFTSGGLIREGDGVRDLYVGSLAQVPAGSFPQGFDYLALGHLHAPQAVGERENWRYSGSPLPMSFSEADGQKSVCLVDFSVRSPSVRLLPVPAFQQLRRIGGDWPALCLAIRTLVAEGSEAWLEVVYEGEEVIPGLREELDELVRGSGLEILRVKNTRLLEGVLLEIQDASTLEGLDECEVFEMCLNENNIPAEQREQLELTFKELLGSMDQRDPLEEPLTGGGTS